MDSTIENTKVSLKNLTVAGESGDLFNETSNISAKFHIRHEGEVLVVEQTLTLKRTHNEWIAEMPMDDFPPQKTATEAAIKLADWMEKMAVAIRGATFDTINLNEL